MRGSGNLKTVVGYDRSDTVTMKNLPRDIKDPGENTFMNYGYEYSPAGNITAKNTEHGNYEYEYDELYRLTDAVNPASDDETYTYDAIGNRLTAAFSSQPSADSYTYNANNELAELLTYNSELINYSYDDDGNMTQKTTGAQITNYIYDIQDRLVQVEDGSSSVIAEYYYDPFGRRLWKEVSGVRIYYFYSDEGLIGEYDAGGTEIKTYGYWPDSTWGTNPMFQKIGTDYYWYINDHLGTPQVIIDTTGRVVWAATYDSFGNAQISAEDITNNLRFAGQYYDGETGLHYNLNRYYDPQTGRYTRVDPIGFAGGDLNLYAYTANNPVNFIDPWGLFDIMSDNITYEYIHKPKPTGKERYTQSWDVEAIGNWQRDKAIIAALSVAGGVGLGSKTYVIGYEYYEREYIKTECIRVYCHDSKEMKDLDPCKEEKGSGYWVREESYPVIRTNYVNGPEIDNQLNEILKGQK